MNQLNELFEELNNNGIRAYQNFGCCSKCGLRQIFERSRSETNGSEAPRREIEEEDKVGICFYHYQSVINAVETGYLAMDYTSLSGTIPDEKKVIKLITDSCTNAGFKPDVVEYYRKIVFEINSDIKKQFENWVDDDHFLQFELEDYLESRDLYGEFSDSDSMENCCIIQ
jgi:hypothetical protein